MGCSASPCRGARSERLPTSHSISGSNLLPPGNGQGLAEGPRPGRSREGALGVVVTKLRRLGQNGPGGEERPGGAGVIGRAGGVKWVKHPDVLLNKKLGNKAPQPGPPRTFPTLFPLPFHPLSRRSPSAVPQPQACDAIPRADTDGLIIDSRIILLLTFLITNISTPALKAYKEECFVCVLPSVLNTSFRLF